MDYEIERLLVSMRADTSGFARDVAEMRGVLEGPLAAGVDRAGRALEDALIRAVRTGKLGFDDLKRVTLSAMGEIAAAAIRGGIGAIFGGGAGAAAGGSGGCLVGRRLISALPRSGLTPPRGPLKSASADQWELYMSDATAQLALPFILPGQAQKEFYHNESLTRIDIALHAAVRVRLSLRRLRRRN